MNVQHETAKNAWSSVAVVIPCFNAERTVGRTIQSVLAQEYPNLELIVVNDGSSDGSLAVIQSFGDRVRAVTGLNRGACAARNRGLSLANSEFILFVDADDYIEDSLIHCLAEAARGTTADVAIGRSVSESEARGRYNSVSYPTIASELDLIRGWLRGRIVQTGALLWRVVFLRSIGGWDERVERGQDEDLALRALLMGARAVVSSRGLVVWVHTDNAQRVSRVRSEAVLLSQLEAYERVRCLANSRGVPIRRELGLRFHRLAKLAYLHGFDRVGIRGVVAAHSLGYTPGLRMYHILWNALGEARKRRISSLSHNVHRIFSLGIRNACRWLKLGTD